MELQSPIVHRLGRDRAGTVAFGRLFANRSVMPEEIFAAAAKAALVGACSGGAYLFSVAADWPEADRMVLDLPPRKARARRRARLALKYGTVEICRPRHCSTAGCLNR